MTAAPEGASTGLPASFSDGRSAQVHPVLLRLGHEGIDVQGSGISLQYAWPRVRVSERLDRAPRLISFDDGASCEVSAQQALDLALAQYAMAPGPVERLQRRWIWSLLAALALAAGLAGAYVWLLPAAADLAARNAPPFIEESLGGQATQFIELHTAPTRLSGPQAQRIWSLFEKIAPPGGRDYRVVLRDGGDLGANAIALPGGTIVVTDQLVQLASEDAALQGVLAHEIGHIENRHFLRQLASSAAVGAVVTLIAGDASLLATALPAALADLSYSRDMESEADDYAVSLLRSKGIAVGPFADLLAKLQEASGQGGSRWSAYLQTHPDTGVRIAAIRSKAG